MWGKSSEGNALPVPPPVPAPAAPRTTPAAPAAPIANPSRSTVLGKTVKIVGNVSSSEEMWVGGELEGTLELQGNLTIGPESKVKANIKAKDVEVFGAVRGNIEAENRISLRPGASLTGDIKTAGIIIDDGAYFKGGIDICRTDQPQGAPRAAGASAGERR